MFAGVQDEQQLLVGEPLAQHVHGHPQGVVAEPDRVGDGGEEQSVVVERSEVGPPGAVAVAGFRAAGRADRQPGLADPMRRR